MVQILFQQKKKKNNTTHINTHKRVHTHKYTYIYAIKLSIYKTKNNFEIHEPTN